MGETIYRTCHLCEALCGLKVEVENNRVVDVGSDKSDVFSQGYAYPTITVTNGSARGKGFLRAILAYPSMTGIDDGRVESVVAQSIMNGISVKLRKTQASVVDT